MKKTGMTLSMATALGLATLVVSGAQGAPGSASSQLSGAAKQLGLVEKTQFFIGDQEYCWYDDAWNGPGWYWCGYATRPGLGWGGRLGWHHWDRHHPPHHPVHGPGSSHNPTSPSKPKGNPFKHPSHPLKPKPRGGGTNNGGSSGNIKH